jgi:hypothetical protein
LKPKPFIVLDKTCNQTEHKIAQSYKDKYTLACTLYIFVDNKTKATIKQRANSFFTNIFVCSAMMIINKHKKNKNNFISLKKYNTIILEKKLEN